MFAQDLSNMALVKLVLICVILTESCVDGFLEQSQILKTTACGEGGYNFKILRFPVKFVQEYYVEKLSCSDF